MFAMMDNDYQLQLNNNLSDDSLPVQLASSKPSELGNSFESLFIQEAITPIRYPKCRLVHAGSLFDRSVSDATLNLSRSRRRRRNSFR
jgi:hypothetical protein